MSPAGEKPRRHHRWHRDEFILTLDLYLKKGFAKLSTSAPEVVELSETLRALPFNLGARDPEYRSPGSVHLRLANFAHHDQSYPGEGMSGGGEECGRIWAELGARPVDVARMAIQIRQGLAAPQESIETDEEHTAVEGAIVARMHLTRERDRGLTSRKKAQALKRHGKLACEACGFDFEHRYGPRGQGYIECHHRVPLSELDEARPTKLADLALLCSNCHRMIHARSPWLTFDELIGLVAPSATRG